MDRFARASPYSYSAPGKNKIVRLVVLAERVASAVMRQAHAEGVATQERAIAAIEKDLCVFGDDVDEDEGAGENGEAKEVLVQQYCRLFLRTAARDKAIHTVRPPKI